MSTTQIERAFKAWPEIDGALFVPRTQREYRAMVKLLDRLIDEVGEDEDHPLASMMDIIGVLIEKYEDEKVPELA